VSPGSDNDPIAELQARVADLEGQVGDLQQQPPTDGFSETQLIVNSDNTVEDPSALTEGDISEIFNELLGEELPIEEPGDLIVGDQEGLPSTLPVGFDGDVLIADSAEAQGVRWGEPNSGSPLVSGLYASDGTGEITVTPPAGVTAALIHVFNVGSVGSNASELVWGETKLEAVTEGSAASSGPMSFGEKSFLLNNPGAGPTVLSFQEATKTSYFYFVWLFAESEVKQNGGAVSGREQGPDFSTSFTAEELESVGFAHLGFVRYGAEIPYHRSGTLQRGFQIATTRAAPYDVMRVEFHTQEIGATEVEGGMEILARCLSELPFNDSEGKGVGGLFWGVGLKV
jgi:hypothetical protein